MRLIIEISKGEYDKICKTMTHTSSGNPNFYFESKIANATLIPDNATVCDIEQIKAEIEAARYGLINDGLDVALSIIDKYTKGE